jgi:Alternative complex III, ActD subunit
MERRALYGLMTEFDNAEDLLKAAKQTHDEGYRCMDAYSPFPIHGLAEAVGYRHRILPWLVLAGGILGGLGGFGLQYWVSVIELPVNIGGRPFNSWPSFIPVTFECTILGAALTAVLGMLALNGLPKPYHPVFNAERFRLASSNRFFLCIEAADRKFEESAVTAYLKSLSPYGVIEVEK